MKLTGIDKRPVEGPVMVTRPRAAGMGMVGLAGDRVYDVRNHGGPDQAVYAYAREDLDWWVEQLGLELPNGAFGENLTTAGLDVSGALLGETWRVGTAVLQEPRGCFHLHHRRAGRGLVGVIDPFLGFLEIA